MKNFCVHIARSVEFRSYFTSSIYKNIRIFKLLCDLHFKGKVEFAALPEIVVTSCLSWTLPA